MKQTSNAKKDKLKEREKRKKRLDVRYKDVSGNSLTQRVGDSVYWVELHRNKKSHPTKLKQCISQQLLAWVRSRFCRLPADDCVFVFFVLVFFFTLSLYRSLWFSDSCHRYSLLLCFVSVRASNLGRTSLQKMRFSHWILYANGLQIAGKKTRERKISSIKWNWLATIFWCNRSPLLNRMYAKFAYIRTECD